MVARTNSSNRTNLALWAAAVLGVGLMALVPISLSRIGRSSPATSPVVASPDGRIVYVEYGRGADVVWSADPARPQARSKLLSIAHAPEFGIVPSLAPAGDRFAFTALPVDTAAPAPDAPAELRAGKLAGLQTGKSESTLLARNVDLRVRPLWSIDGASVVFRRSDAAGYTLVAAGADGGAEQVLAAATEAALFPVAFGPDGGSFYYVELTAARSELVALDVASGERRMLGRLADGLTRDWALAPAGDRLAYLEMTFLPGHLASRAHVIELASGKVSTMTPDGADEFSPTWDRDGALLIGRLAPGTGAAGVVRIAGDGTTALAPPTRGFDLPLGAPTPGGRLALRSFDGGSALAPGVPSLIVLAPDGGRSTIATGEVTYLGWTGR